MLRGIATLSSWARSTKLSNSGRTVRAKISLDAALLDAIDAAKERGLSRSAFLASAAREKIMAVA